MSCRLLLEIQGPESSEPFVVPVQEDYDQAMNKLMPLQGISSALESREACTWTHGDGSRVFVKPQLIGAVLEGDGSEN